MTLNPEDIYNKSFRKRFSIRSYDTKEVDDFLDIVGNYYEDLLIENRQLKEKIEELRQEIDYYKSLNKSVEDTLEKAQERVKAQYEDAKKEADLIVREAEIKANKILEEAKMKKDKIIQDANLEGEKIINQAQNKSEEKYRQYQKLVESERLFKIRFKTLLKTQLESLDDNDLNLELLKDELKEEA